MTTRQSPAVAAGTASTAGTDRGPGGHGGADRLAVAIVEDYPTNRLGFRQTLERDPRMRVVADVASVRELVESGAEYDVCLADLIGVASEGEFLGLVRDADVVVCTAAENWRVRVAPWVHGARAVLGKQVVPTTLTDAVWDARHRPHELRPHLASALCDAVRECGLDVPAAFGDLLRMTARGTPGTVARQRLGIPEDRYVAELGRLRAACARAGLGELDLISLPGARPAPARAPAAPVAADWSRFVTGAERRTLELRADGLTAHEIATTAGISYDTVISQLRSALGRFGLTSAPAELTLIFAMYVCGRHSQPESLLRRLKAEGARPPGERGRGGR